MSAVKQMGLRIPSDVSVVAIHDLPLAAYLDPPLTTVRMPLEELGRRGVELLATLGSDQAITEVLQGAIELVVRGSAAPPSRKVN
jgi:LacI family transcriptional regulator